MSKRFIFHMLVLISCITLASAELRSGRDLKDERAGYAFDHRFSLDSAFSSLERIQGSLRGFRDLTEEAWGRISKERLQKSGNTEWEAQSVSFSNQLKSIEGTLRMQDYLIKKLQYQLIQEQTKQGTGKKGDLREAQKAYEQSEQSFREFREGYNGKD